VGSNKTIKVSVRIIAATNRNLEELIAAGRFRSDLFYRLNVFPLEIPPLRHRSSDISQLVRHFLERFSNKFGRKIDTVQKETMELLTAYAWPGNVRELQNIIERAVVLSAGNVLYLDEAFFPKASHPIELRHTLHAETPTSDLKNAEASSLSVRKSFPSLNQMERTHILAALRLSTGMIGGPNGAARLLNLHPNTLRSKMAKLGIDRKGYENP
jgi:formate hydrogenlyase transcriptional activator